MSFSTAPWAIDGPIINSALARQQTHITSSGSEGVAQAGHLKVAPLNTPGVGVQIAAGGGVVLNRYQTNGIDQSYVVSNPDPHIIPSDSMPGSVPVARSFILAVVIGDPQYSRLGHPWMPSTGPEAGQESSFVYVRPTLIPVASGATSLSVNYPALVLARIDIPANTTTITAGMITDLRRIARPRTEIHMGQTAGGVKTLNSAANVFTNFPPNDALTVRVPEWATKAVVMGFVEGLYKTKLGFGELAITIRDKGISGIVTPIDEPAPAGNGDRVAYNVAATLDVTSVRGQTVSFATLGRPLNTASVGFLQSNANTTVGMTVQFKEDAV